MKGKSLALLVLALGCGLVAALGITQVLGKRSDTSTAGETTPVFVASADIGSGTLVNQDTVKLEQWPKDRVPAGALGRLEDLDGRRTRQKIYAGEPLLEPKLLARGQSITDLMVPNGLRVVAIPVGIEAIVGGLVLPGSRCDLQVYMRADSSSGVGETLCKTILQDIRVLAVNDVTSTESGDPRAPETRSFPAAKTVSFLVTPAQAQIVTMASQLGSVKLILRSGDDHVQTKTVAMTAHELIGASGSGDRRLEDPKQSDEERFKAWAEKIRQELQQKAKVEAAGARPSEEPERFTMRIRSGPEVSDVLLVHNAEVQGLPDDEGAWTVMGLGPSTKARGSSASRTARAADAGPVVVPPAAAAAAPPKSPADNSLPPGKPAGN